MYVQILYTTTFNEFVLDGDSLAGVVVFVYVFVFVSITMDRFLLFNVFFPYL